jgi:patatin-related protein
MPTSPVREIRLGLVCYGGVSLAIYMHGMTKELQKLVVASRALEADPEHNTLPDPSSERVYWEILKRVRERSPDQALPRVVIDVVAGTSAGGINGVILAKGLAHNLSQDALRGLWFEKGDVKALLGGGVWQETLHVGEFVAGLFRSNQEKTAAPFDGQAMLGWLLDALKAMEKDRPAFQPPAGPPASLMPENHPLQLFVTTTDYYGYRQYLTIADPPTVSERRNRVVLDFTYRPEEGVDQFGPGYNGILAFAARATSSFPGAFPPVHLADAQELPADVEQEFFRPYQLSGAKAGATWFVDGGVLNNYPFQPAIEAIVKLRAESEVSRYLLYLQPDPGTEVQNPTGQAPSFFGSIWAGLSSVASSQPILEELLAARSFNERVQRIDELVARTRADIEGIFQNELQIPLDQPLEGKGSDELKKLRDQLDGEAEKRAGYLFDPYLQIRAHSIVEQFALGVCQLCNFEEEESNIAFLIRLILDEWAQQRQLIGAEVNLDERRSLLNQFDLGYTRRRLAFVLQGVNGLYKPRDGQPAPPREDLDKAKTALYSRIGALKKLIDASNLGGDLVRQVRDQFPLTLTDPIDHGQSLTDFARDFVAQDQNRAMMDRIFAGLAELLRTTKDQVHAGLYEDFRTITAGWTPGQRKEVMLRYFGFPFWDAMIYPATRLSEAGELRPLNIVRMSPSDSTGLGYKTAKDKLKGVQDAHFGAFLKEEWRQNDYLWGRLDAVERLIGLVLQDAGGPPAGPADLKPAFAAVLAEEAKTAKPLSLIQPLLAELGKKIAALPDQRH